MPSKTKNLNQNSGQIKKQKQSPKKESFSLMTVKTLLAILLFTGMGVIIIGGGYIIVKHTISLPDKTNLPIVNPVVKTQCEIDTDCELRFSGCDCRYYCLKKGNKVPSCSKMCDRETENPEVSSCICLDNECVTKNSLTSEELSDEIQSLIQQMGDDNISQEIKNEISEKLYNYRKEAISYLIEALDDERVFDPCYVFPSSESLDSCSKLLVKSECMAIIKRIITPVPSPKVVFTDKGYRFSYRVDNWQQWWEENQDKSLNEIRKMIRDWYRGEEEKNNYLATGYRGEEYDYLDFIGNLTLNDWDWDKGQSCYGLNEVNQCDCLDWPIKYGGGCRAANKFTCYNCIVKINGDFSVCEKIILENKTAEDFHRNGCYWNAATALDKKGMNDKIDFCDKFKGEWGQWYEEECLRLAK